MRLLVKPTIVVSKCLGFEACSYNVQIKKSKLVKDLGEFVNYIKVCPECEIGLGIPRDTIRIVQSKEGLRLIQPKTQRDITENMKSYCKDFLSTLENIDGCILKSRSPSCGPKDVKIYYSEQKGSASKAGMGFFSSAIKEKYPQLPIEDEGRLTSLRIRENFLTRLFSLAYFKAMKKEYSISALTNFHNNNRLLFMSYNQKQFKALEHIVKERNMRFDIQIKKYEDVYYQIFFRMPRIASHINVLMDTFDIFSNRLSIEEKVYFNSCIKKYEEEKLSLSSVVALLKSYIIRFEDNDLLEQTYFNPYPEQLISLSNSEK